VALSTVDDLRTASATVNRRRKVLSTAGSRGRAGEFRGPIVDILISAAYALGVVERLREQVARLYVVEDLPQGLRHLDRAIESIVSAGSVLGCGTLKPATIRRAAR
jgi:hypothetical protein